MSSSDRDTYFAQSKRVSGMHTSSGLTSGLSQEEQSLAEGGLLAKTQKNVKK